MHHFRVELHAVEFALVIGDRGAGGVVRVGQNLKPAGQLGARIAVAHPHGGTVFHVGEQVGGIIHKQGRFAIFAPIGCFHEAAQLLHHQLHSVANAQHRNAQVPEFRVAQGRTIGIDGTGAARQNDALGAKLPQLLCGGAIGQNFGINLGFANPTGNQFGILGAKVQNGDELAIDSGVRRSDGGR